MESFIYASAPLHREYTNTKAINIFNKKKEQKKK